MAWIATKEMKTAKFTLFPGMTLPPIFSRIGIVQQLKKQFGNDAIVSHDYRRDGEFGMDARKLLKTVAEMKESNGKSDKIITELSAANASLSNEVEDSRVEVQRLTERVVFLETEQRARSNKK